MTLCSYVDDKEMLKFGIWSSQRKTRGVINKCAPLAYPKEL